jgi:hypothetical protein
LEKLFPSYELYLEEPNGETRFVMSARKRKKSKSSNYILSTGHITTKKKFNVIGKVRSNFLGTAFTVYDAGFNPFKEKDDNEVSGGNNVRREFAAVTYVRIPWIWCDDRIRIYWESADRVKWP